MLAFLILASIGGSLMDAFLNAALAAVPSGPDAFGFWLLVGAAIMAFLLGVRWLMGK